MFQPALTMNTVLACVHAQGHPSAVCDGATWAARRLHAPLNFLQVIDEGEAHTGETRFSDLTGYDTGPTRTRLASGPHHGGTQPAPRSTH